MADTVLLRKVYALDSNTGLFISSNRILLTDGKGGTNWLPLISSLTVVGGGVIGDLPSTLSTTSSLLQSSIQEISSLWSTTSGLQSNISSITPGNVTPSNLTSTVTGLSDSGYISSTQLISSLSSLGTFGYVSSLSLTSTVTGLANIGYISSTQLISSLDALGSTYISSASLASSLTSTQTGLGTLGYISSSWLTSTLDNLGLYQTISTGYVSTATLNSTVTSLLARPVSFNTVNSCTVNSASTVVISNATNLYYTSSFYIAMSSFYFSTCAVTGSVASNVGAVISNTSNMVFSTATFNLNTFTPLLNSNSRVTLEYSPTFVFSAPFLTGAANPTNLTMISQIYYAGNSMKAVSTANLFYNPNPVANVSSVFQPQIKITLPSNIVQTMLANSNSQFFHQIQGGYAGGSYTGGFATSNFTVFNPTSSIFISVQNNVP